MDTIIQNIETLVKSIHCSLKNRWLLPCLSLLYTGIDVLGSLERGKSGGVRDSFVRWSSTYMLPGSDLNCTALELYGARCGILHTFTADSDLHAQGSIRKLFYAWGSANTEALQKSIDTLEKPAGAVHITDLINAFSHGVDTYFEELKGNPSRWNNIATGAGLWFVNMTPDQIDNYNAQWDENNAG
ncbi:MAG: hypothetical protein HQ475_04045 [SAR202 cluster bacterium]|nr:hypothetical protein [SAR202 cluster bacterium]